MVFYSYEFLKSKVQQIDYIQLGLTLFCHCYFSNCLISLF